MFIYVICFCIFIYLVILIIKIFHRIIKFLDNAIIKQEKKS